MTSASSSRGVNLAWVGVNGDSDNHSEPLSNDRLRGHYPGLAGYTIDGIDLADVCLLFINFHIHTFDNRYSTNDVWEENSHRRRVSS